MRTVSGATSRRRKLASAATSLNWTRCEPTAIATPQFSAAAARLWLMRCISGSSPPVMEEMRSGRRRVLPRKGQRVSMSASASSGRARCVRRRAAKPLPPRSMAGSCARASRCSRLRRPMELMRGVPERGGRASVRRGWSARQAATVRRRGRWRRRWRRGGARSRRQGGLRGNRGHAGALRRRHCRRLCRCRRCR